MKNPVKQVSKHFIKMYEDVGMAMPEPVETAQSAGKAEYATKH